MKKRIDLSGQTIGRWKVSNYVVKKHKTYFHCICLDCKEEKDIYGYNLRNKPPLCACKGRMTNKHIIGERFGDLTIIEKIVIDKRTYCKCECECGGIKLVEYRDLKSGYNKSCGCRSTHKESIRKALEKYCRNGTYVPGITRKTINKNNTTGYKGVSYRKDRNKYRAYIKYQGKYIFLGNYNNIEDAVKARQLAEEKYFGKY